MKLVVTTRELHYDGKARLKGETFHATEKHAQLLKLLKKAEDAPPEAAEPMGQVATTQPAPEAPEAEAVEPAARRTRTYKIRALTAED